MEPRIPKYVPAANVVLKFLTRRGIKTGPVSVITVAGRSSSRPHSTPVTPWTVDGRRYVVAGIGTSDWARNARAAGAGTMTSGRTTTRVWLTEVTDPALKERVVVAFGTGNPGGGAFLRQVGVAPDRTPKGLAAARPLRCGLRSHARLGVETLSSRPRPGRTSHDHENSACV